jgi:hypothetical protein
MPSIRFVLACLAMSVCMPASALVVSGHVPTRNALNIAPTQAIHIDFDAPVDRTSITAQSLRIFGQQRGPLAIAGRISWSANDTRLTFTPAEPFFAGEVVGVQLAASVRAVAGSTLRQAGYGFQYTVRARPASAQFSLIDTVSVRTTGALTRLYGGAFADLNDDDYVDYIAINEISADLRVLLNRADGSGLLGAVLLPPPAIGLEASPSELGDFDNDGRVDIVTSNTSSDSVSVALGTGNGRFNVLAQVAVADTPHGIAALDIDGDADADLVVATEGGNTLSVLTNNGAGVFGNRVDFNSGGNGEYALAAGDMNNDGIMDLVVGTRNDNRVIVLTGTGAGVVGGVAPFVQSANVAGGGLLWKLVLGDVDGDGNLDVAAVNGQSNNGAILRGNGAGGLGAATTYAFNGQMVATDLGDLDGDGDLDWVTSSYGASRWYVLRNDGGGTYTQVRQIFATANASCASLYDIDNDGDLDMMLADEVDDVILIMRNGNLDVFADGYEPQGP